MSDNECPHCVKAKAEAVELLKTHHKRVQQWPGQIETLTRELTATLRDQFAMAVLPTCALRPDMSDEHNAARAYAIADAMLEARKT